MSTVFRTRGQDGETRALGSPERAGAEESEGWDAGKVVLDAPWRGSSRPCGQFEERSVRWTAPISATPSPFEISRSFCPAHSNDVRCRGRVECCRSACGGSGEPSRSVSLGRARRRAGQRARHDAESERSGQIGAQNREGRRRRRAYRRRPPHAALFTPAAWPRISPPRCFHHHLTSALALAFVCVRAFSHPNPRVSPSLS